MYSFEPLPRLVQSFNSIAHSRYVLASNGSSFVLLTSVGSNLDHKGISKTA